MSIYALSPAGHVSGGPESMHQLVHTLRTQGFDAYIHYFGGVPPIAVPKAYRHYDVEVADLVPDSPDSIVITAETTPYLLNKLRLCRKAIWWLSVDNYVDQCNVFGVYQVGVTDRHPFEFVFDPRQKITHLTHSEYGRLYCAMQGVTAIPLGDYISDKFTSICAAMAGAPRRNRVAYNPKKGKLFTQALIEAAGGSVDWLPIQDMTYEQVAEALATSKLYIDFGEHPGQDHLPKEAALAGCCVLTGTRGAAANPVDLPLPQGFKLNEATAGAVDRVLDTVRWILADYEEITELFDPYRRWTLSHEELFTAQVAKVFGPTGPLSAKPQRRAAQAV